MKTFMLGWEFPPFISGGLGTACYGLTKAMDRLGIEVTFVLPRAGGSSCHAHAGNVQLLSIEGLSAGKLTDSFRKVRFYTIESALRPYAQADTYQHHLMLTKTRQAKVKVRAGVKPVPTVEQDNYSGDMYSGVNPVPMEGQDNYSGDMYSDIYRYADKAAGIAAGEAFDIIHAHDWMTYPAGIAVSRVSGRPLIVHVHSTEFDRSGEHVNQTVYDIERRGMHAAAKVIAVSNFTKNIIVRHYDIPPEKVEVVHNGVEHDNGKPSQMPPDKTNKIVLFLGRITMQKGPEYFLAAAKKVLEVIDNVKFIMVGNGDMMHRTIELAARMAIGHKVFFTGFLRGDDVNRVYEMADLYVMPSVSEPFGIAPLEAMRRNVPVLISRQSGIAEAVTHALKVDFWDINEMANKMIAVLKRSPLQATLRRNGFCEADKFRWENSALKVKKVYEETLALLQTA